jgi:hypothetical protein
MIVANVSIRSDIINCKKAMQSPNHDAQNQMTEGNVGKRIILKLMPQ